MERYSINPVYDLIEGKVWTEGIGNYSSYGIICCQKDQCGIKTVVQVISDISTHREKVCEMVKTFNLCHMTSDCFLDVVIGFVS